MSNPSESQVVSWRRLGVESLAVLASILLAFSIDAWWDGRQERERESDLLDAIAADFVASRPQLQDRLALARRMSEVNGLFLDSLTGRPPGTVLSVPDSLILSALTGPTYEPNTNALDAALASGEIELIRNRELRSLLATWRRTLSDTSEDELEVRRITNEQVVPQLSASISLAPYFANVLTWTGGDPFGPGSALEDTLPSGLSGNGTIIVSTELEGAIAARKFYAEFSAADLETLLQVLDSTLVLLQRNQGQSQGRE